MDAYNPDRVLYGLDAIFCGVNPGVSAEASGHSFSHRSNRFWEVLHLSGFTDRRLDPLEEECLLNYRCGLTVVVRRSTPRASDVSPEEFRRVRPEFEKRMRHVAPRSLAFLGKRAFAAMLGVRSVRWGYQPTGVAGIATWVLPNPSGRNRSFNLQALVRAFGDFRTTLETRVAENV